MKLRTQILVFLLIIGLLPLTVAVALNLPMVLERLGAFHRQAYLQELRADFRDLDQHLAARHEMVRLLAKLPEPGQVLDSRADIDPKQVDLARTRYTEWVNRILPDQLDIIEISFLDNRGVPRFWLTRDREQFDWRPSVTEPALPERGLIEAALALDQPTALVSRMQLRPEQKQRDPRRFMNLYLASPILQGPGQPAQGLVLMTVDVGGIARAYRRSLWVHDDGRYLEVPGMPPASSRAFDDFPGLEQTLAAGKLALWSGPRGEQVIWVPLIQTEGSGPIWVGRSVDPSPLADFQSALIQRVLAIVLVLALLTWLIARWVSLRAERIGRKLTDGIARILEKDEPVRFNWHWSDELRRLGDGLSQLSARHVRNNSELRRHAAELEESNRYKSQFLANVSHELRTPLNSILLLSKMLADDRQAMSPDKRKQAEVMHQAAVDLRALIDNILDLSRIEARQAQFHLEDIDLPALLDELCELVRPQFDARGLYLKLEIADDAPRSLRSDADKLRQIIKNFLSNAAKFTSEGGATLSLTLADESVRAHCPVCIRVSDTGIGIAPDKHALVFEAFKQADGSTNRRYGGTGLGLTISRQLAHLLGGDIRIDSSPGEGASFCLLLPLAFDAEQLGDAQVSNAPAAEAPAVEQPAQALEPLFIGQHALLVDADVDNLLSLTPLLEGWGFSVTGAADAEEALEAVEDEHCSVVLVDLLQAASDGYATIERIRAHANCAAVPVVALVEQAPPRDCAADAWLSRPVDPQKLHRLLNHLLLGEDREDASPS